MKDIQILDALQGGGDVVTSLRFYCLKRKGYLLLALPEDKELAGLTLGLYQPQSNKAKLWVRGGFDINNIRASSYITFIRYGGCLR